MSLSLIRPRHSARHRAMLGGVLAAGALAGTAAVAPDAQAFTLNQKDAQFVLDQILVAENGSVIGPGPNQILDPTFPRGLRTVDGSGNNLVNAAQGGSFGVADLSFPRMLTPNFRPAEVIPAGFPGEGNATSYAQTAGTVADSQPRTISNLIVDQTDSNPVAGPAATAAGGSLVVDGDPTTPDPYFIPNANNDLVSAPYNSWFTIFGQFFDHGLDLVQKGGNGSVVIPLQPDDPLLPAAAAAPFMVLTRATQTSGEHKNIDSPFVDQSQTYTSHPSHQVFLREYELNGAGDPVATGRMLDGSAPNPDAGLPTWADVKAQAATLLGITLTDQDVFDVPEVVTDEYGRFIPGPGGLPQLTGNLTGHAFLDDIAHFANPRSQGVNLNPDADAVITPGPPAAGEYDNELLDEHFIAGDGRANENIALTSVHFVFHAEHNRLVQQFKDIALAAGNPFLAQWELSPGVWNGERLFQAARFATEMQYQHLVFEEFARKVAPGVIPFGAYDTTLPPSIVAEFAHAVYRFGHSMLTETVARTGTGPIPLFQAFLNPQEFDASGATPALAAGNIAAGMAGQTGNELDEFVTNVLRNRLVGLPLDLASLNLARGRDTGVKRLNEARAELTSGSGAALPPYTSWADFKAALRHPESVVNFIAAYGIDSTITGDLNTRRAAAQALHDAPDQAFMNGSAGLNDIDLWIGGLAERADIGNLLGPTFNFVFQTQMERLQNGDRFYYLGRLPGTNFATELEANSLAELVMRNAAGVVHLPGDVFSVPGLRIEAGALPNPLPTGVTNVGGQVRYAGGLHVVIGGTAGANNLRSDQGDDTLWGDAGADILQAGDGVDSVNGGDGNDTLLGEGGIDTLKGGTGNDILRGGTGLLDLLLPGPGNDLSVAGPEGAETLGALGNDLILGGVADDAMTGHDGDDWMEGGAGLDTLVGGNAAPFHLGRGDGDDVMDGGAGLDAHDGEDGADIIISSPESDGDEGLFGFDWVTHARDTVGVDADLNFFPPVPIPGDTRDTFLEVEGLSGSNLNDVLRGSNATAATMADHVMTNPGLITGLPALLPAGATSFTGGDILIGGGGADILEGRSGDDIIDGDAMLNAQLDRDGNNALLPVNTLAEIQAGLTLGQLNTMVIRRTIAPGVGAGNDTAQFSDVFANYTVTNNAGVLTVAHTGGTQADGTDTLRNVEAVQFADVTFVISGTNAAPVGTVNVSSNTPVEGQALTATRAFNDIDGIPGAVTFSWQALTNPAAGGNGWTNTGGNASLTPSNAHVGLQLRAVATYIDGGGTPQQVFSAPTGQVANVNDPATGAPVISDTTPAIGQTLTATKGTIADLDGMPADSAISYQWQVSAGTGWAPTDSGPTFTPDALYAGRQIRVIASFTDSHGTQESRTSAPTAALPGVPVVLPGSPPPPVALAGNPAPPPAAALATLSIKSFKVVPTGAKKPFTVSFVLNAPATVRFEIRRLNGKLVRAIVQKKKAGKVTIKWNRLDSRGRRVLAGRYRVTIIVTASGVTKRVSKIIRVR